MSLRSRKSAANRFEIDDVLDDLLASDGDESTFRKKETKMDPKPKSASTVTSKPKKLTAAASDAEFYSSLKSLGGAEMDHSEEEEELSDGAVERLAAQIGNLEDLDDNIFGGLGNHDEKKTAERKPVTTPNKSVESDKSVNKTSVSMKRDSSLNDDPLSGLGLSDDDLDLALNKKRAGKKSLLTRSSSYQKGARIEPHGKIRDENEENKLPQSLDNHDPFLTSLTSVASRKQISKRNSDELLVGNLNASDSDVSPRQQAVKQRRSKARRNRKGSVTPSDGDNTDLEASLNKPTKTHSPDSLLTQNDAIVPPKKEKKKEKGEDLFDNSDGLPGMSDEELPEKHIRTVQSGGASKVANSALNSLLTPTSLKKKQEPTMLEKIMASKSASKSEEKLSGGYSPSVASERPTTAPHRRSVTFADQLGADVLSENNSRPISAPEGKQGRKTKAEYQGGNDLDSDLDETTKEWLSLSKSKQEKNVTDQDKSSRKASNDDWLGLGADLTDSFKLESSGELFTPMNDGKNATSTPSGEAVSETNTPKSEIILPVNTKQEEAKSKSVNKGELEQPKILLETPSSRPSTKPPSRHRTPEKEARIIDEPLPALVNKEIDFDLPKQRVFTSTPEVKTGKEKGDEFLSLLKQSKEKQQIKKSDNDESSHPEISVNMMDIQIDNNSSLTEQLHVPPKCTDTGLHTIHDITTNEALNDQSQKIKPHIEVEVNNLVTKQDPAIIQLLSRLVLQSPQRGTMAQTDSDMSTATTSGVPSAPPLAQVRALKDQVIRSLDMQHQEEFNAVKRQFERDRSYLEAEVKELQTKVLQLEESRTCSTTGYSKSVRELEGTVRKLELERDQLLISLNSLRERHKLEIDDLEASHKTRIGFLEDAHKQRESQHSVEAQTEKQHYEECLKALMNEKEDLLQICRKKEESWDKTKMADINRLKSLHEKTLEELICEHNSQLEHLKIMKEQEVAATLSAFSHTKSLQGLMQEVQDSARQVSTLQAKIDASHKSQTDSHEITLKSKDDYLKNLQERLIQQERNNEEERKHLQSLIEKMEIQLREQTRQIEQDKWKVSQEESRVKTMQTAFEEEKRIMMEKIMQDREQVSKAREEMLVDQRKVVAECCEEKRKIENERIKLLLQRDPMDQSSLRLFNSDPSDIQRYQQNSASFNELMREKGDLIQEQKEIQKAIVDVRTAGDRIEQRSKEVEEFSHEAKRVYEKGMEASQAAHFRQSELDDMSKQLDVRMATVQHLEEKLREEQDRYHIERALIEREKEGNKCLNCKTPLPPQHQQQQLQLLTQVNPQLQLQQQQVRKHPEQASFVHTQQQHPSVVTPHQPSNILSPLSQKHGVQWANIPPDHQTHGSTNVNLSSANASVLQYNGEQRQTSTPDEIMLERGKRKMAPNLTYSIDNGMRTYSVDSLMGIMNNQNNGRNDEEVLKPGVDDSDAGSLPPPDLLMNSFEYKRAMRRYSHEKDKDDNYLEEEAQFLKMLHERRLR